MLYVRSRSVLGVVVLALLAALWLPRVASAACDPTDYACLTYEQNQEGGGGLFDGIKNGLGSVVDGIGGVASGLTDLGGSIGDAISSAVQAVVEPMTQSISDMLAVLFVPPGGFGPLVDDLEARIDDTPLGVLANLTSFWFSIPSILGDGGGQCGTVPVGTITSWNDVSLCGVLGSAAAMGDWSGVRNAVRIGFWLFFSVALYRSITRLMAGV